MQDPMHDTEKTGYSPLPLFVDMRGKRALVVGGGCVAQRKIETLVDHGCQVTVITPEATDKIRDLADRGLIELILRSFDSKDVQGSFLVFACTDSPELNRRVTEIAEAAGALVNCVDSKEPEVSTPATLRRGDLQVAVSTAGASPALARRIRCGLEGAFPRNLGRAVRLIGQARLMILERVDDPKTRHRLNRLIAEDRWVQRILGDEDYTAEALFTDACHSLKEREDS